MAVRQGLERNKCWAAAWDWKLNVDSIVLIYMQQTNGLYLEISGANCKCGIVYSVYTGFILYCNWNRLTAETLGTFSCEHKIFRKRVRKENING